MRKQRINGLNLKGTERFEFLMTLTKSKYEYEVKMPRGSSRMYKAVHLLATLLDKPINYYKQFTFNSVRM